MTPRDPHSSAGRAPNILMFMTDQQRWDAVGCIGGWVKTPQLDEIAAGGVNFVNAYTNSPVCIPARVALATGLYPHDLKLWDNRHYQLSPERHTWMLSIREAGYRTSVFGKTHLHPHQGDLREREYLMNAYGLDDVEEIAGPKASMACESNLTDLWRREGVYDDYRNDMKNRYRTKAWMSRPSPLPFDLYPDVYVGRKAAEYLRGYHHDKPWFCWVSFSGPHEPWDAPEPYAGMYLPEEMPAPVMPQRSRARRPQGVLDSRLRKRSIPFEEGDVGRLRANYAGGVTLIDDQIGDILKVVEGRGELDNTVIAFVSDHGELNGDWGLIYKQVFLDGAVRIPFLLRAPGLTVGASSEALVELMDLGATLVDLAGGKLPTRSKARSLRPLLEEPARENREIAISELKREVMLVTHDWKLGLNREGRPYLLFDRNGDPTETRNVAGERAYRKVPTMFERRLRALTKEGRGYRFASRTLRRGLHPSPSLPGRVLRKLRRTLRRST